MTEGQCILCGGKSGEAIYAQPNLDLDYAASQHSLAVRTVVYWACHQCGTVSQQPIPSDTVLAKYYAHNMTPQESVANYHDYKAQVYQARIEFLTCTLGPALSSGETLEVGSANGLFLQALSDATGLRPMGIEPSLKASQLASQAGIPTLQGTLQSVDISVLRDRFKLVVSMHTLEHVTDPQAFVKQLAECVAPGGYLYLELPDNGIIPGEQPIAWGDQISPVHIAHYTAEGLLQLVHAAGLTIRHLGSDDRFRYPSFCLLAHKRSAFEVGRDTFLAVSAWQESSYAAAGEKLLQLVAHQRLALWGAGTDLLQVMHVCSSLQQHPGIILADRNPDKIGKQLYGYTIQDAAKLEAAALGAVVITPISRLLRKSIRDDIERLYPYNEVLELFVL